MSTSCDILIVGAGLGGLLTGAALSAAGERVVVVERLKRPGGRFTATDIDGYQVPTGAFHMAPYGSKGALYEMISSLKLDIDIKPFPLMGSLWLDGRITPVKKLVDLWKAFPFYEKLMFSKLVLQGKFDKHRSLDLSFDAWLLKNNQPTQIRELFDAFSQFALGSLSRDLPYIEYRSILKKAIKGCHPGLIMGGCGALTTALCKQIQCAHGSLLLNTEATSILIEENNAVGAVVKSRGDGNYETIYCRQIVYNGGPASILKLLPSGVTTQYWVDQISACKNSEGISMHFACDKPMTSNEGITFCLGTRRVAGFVQQTLTDSSLAPKDKHLLSVFWVPKSLSLSEEISFAQSDLLQVFGDEFNRSCTLLAKGRFHGNWPVNYILQGYDIPQSIPGINNLQLVGDGCKPSGYPMAEGVAGSVQRCLQSIT